MELKQCKQQKTVKGAITFHSVTSPEEGEMVNSQIVETPRALIVIDVPLLKPYALEFLGYIKSLNKPVEKLLVTHAHPDHWLSLSIFKEYKSYALKEAVAEMNMLKDMVVGYHKSLHAALMPDTVSLPTDNISEGTITIDGVQVNIYKVIDAEDNAMMALDIPSVNTLLPQDLVYNKCYMYVATKSTDGKFTVDNWRKQLEKFKSKKYETIIPGHGRHADASVLEENIAYLKFAGEVLSSAKNGEDFKNRFKAKYPDYQIELMLNMSEFMIYQAAPKA